MKIIKVSDEVHEHIMEKKGSLSANQFIEELLERQTGDKVVSGFSQLDRNQLKYIKNLVMDVKNIVLEHTPPEKNIVIPSTPRKVAGGVPRRESRISTEPDWGA